LNLHCDIWFAILFFIFLGEGVTDRCFLSIFLLQSVRVV
jgi:hypothetical protein